MDAAPLQLPMTLHKRFLALIIVALTAAVFFIPGLQGGFIFDDRPNIVQNQALHLADPKLADLPYAAYSFQPGNGSRMLSMATFAFDYWRSGLDPRAFKSTNLLIHVLTTVALGWLFMQLLQTAGWGSRRAAGAGCLFTAIWAVHPLQVSSVLYIVQRMQTLVTLFGVLALIAYLAMRRAQMEGHRSRRYALIAALFLLLGFASKEDAVLYPVYALALELTLLRFRARNAGHSRALVWGYAVAGLIGVTAFAFVIVPRYWQWDVIPGRDFTTLERLMTQARVLMMYLGQMLIPVPSRMTFYYDTLPVSKGLLHPWTTSLSIALLSGLAVWAWQWRRSHPLFALGVFWFFAGHALTSNILNLELAFEHRNHFPLVGIVLALGALWSLAPRRFQTPPVPWATGFAVVALLGGATLMRAHHWGDPHRFASYSLRIAPTSPRAWMALGASYFEKSGGDPKSPFFAKAVEINEIGAGWTDAPAMFSNVVIYKTLRGDVTRRDWDRLLASTRSQPVALQTQYMLHTMLDNVGRGLPLDEQGMVALIDSIARRSHFTAEEYRRFGAYIHNETHSPEKAFEYLEAAVARAPAGDLETDRMFAQLRDAGREDWVERLERIPRRPAAP